MTNSSYLSLIARTRDVALVTLCLCLLLGANNLCAQMVDPVIDRPNEPFSYFSQPTDVLGVMDAREGTLVTPEGYLYTGFGELMFFTGNPAEPVNQRVKTLKNGYLPVVQYDYRQRQFAYRFTMFAATLDGTAAGKLVNFVRVEIENKGARTATAFFSAATRYQNEINTEKGAGDNRFRRPAEPKRLGGYSQAGEDFNLKWIYGFSDDAFVRDGRVMYLFPSNPRPERRLTLKNSSNDVPSIKERTLAVLPTTPVGIVQYRLTLSPGDKQTLEFRMPYEPVPLSGADVNAMRDARFDELLSRTEKFWNEQIAHGIEIAVPETKATDTFKANLIYDLIARDHVGDDYVQTVNKFHYHAFWLRDASYIARMYDLSGYSDYARQVLNFFSRWQTPDGNFVSQGGQFDGWGQVVWAYGQHYRITKDKTFAAEVYPAVHKAVKWLESARASDPLGLMPATTPGDNENITGHVTGHNFWALAGLKNAAVLAEALGHDDDAKEYRQEYDAYKAALLRALGRITPQSGGSMPPGLDQLGGQDWGNLESVYPEMILDPLDPLVTATLRTAQAKYQEGIMTYGNGRWLHHYLTTMNTETELIRGEQERVIEEFYTLLLHTSSTHAGFEYCIRPWGTRDFGANLAPHGWFAAKFRTLMRDMLVREQGDALHVLSAISPEWVKEGNEIEVRRAATDFGEVNYTVRFSAGAASLRFENRFADAPKEIVLHVPWFVDVSSALVDGRRIEPQGGAIHLPANTERVELRWKRRANERRLSYEQTVQDYKTEYRHRYEHFLTTGEATP